MIHSERYYNSFDSIGDITNQEKAWQKTRGSKDIVVAFLDTGVDYTHEDLQPNMWRNPGETGKDENGQDKSTNGKDDNNVSILICGSLYLAGQALKENQTRI